MEMLLIVRSIFISCAHYVHCFYPFAAIHNRNSDFYCTRSFYCAVEFTIAVVFVVLESDAHGTDVVH